MDRIFQMVSEFCSLPRGTSDRDFIMKLVQSMKGILSLYQETLFDERDEHGNDEFYDAIFETMCHLQRLLGEYERTIA